MEGEGEEEGKVRRDGGEAGEEGKGRREGGDDGSREGSLRVPEM